MKFFALLFLLVSSLPSSGQNALFPRGRLAPNVHHSGDVWLYSVARANELFDYNIAVATFAPGAYLNWHRHPKGQQLIILDGEGYYQERGQEVQLVRRGDLVRCGNVEHWHSATPETGVTYLALSGNAPTEWGEPLTEATYLSLSEQPLMGATERHLLHLSQQKWQWMAEKNADTLAHLFHEQAKFIHMGATWTSKVNST